MKSRRTAAIAAVALAAAGLIVMLYTAARSFPRGLVAVGCLLLAMGAGWNALRRRGPARTALAVVGIGLLIGFVAVLVTGRILAEAILMAVPVRVRGSGCANGVSDPCTAPQRPRRQSVRS